ncbi:hypothetical protein PY479_16295 [Shewanella sp. A32]|uniref:hypothetical protein n=1 Tax=Shewanella sp. A32 TaxID=3031327 RepID=UPI0023BA22BC|nr:hypothetical protein [Shewanella sp. A32]MDF0535830.1 hypothetical protein [Shewanella sp. A32]
MGIADLKRNLTGQLENLYQKSQALLNAPAPYWQKLSNAQRVYCFALVSLFFYNDHPFVTVCLTVTALLIEFWPLFTRMWHSLAGKAVILLFYAIIANFSLADSASIVNDVTGVPSTHFNYTHNFTLLLELPIWAVVISAIVLLVMQLIIPFYLLLLLGLKLLGLVGLKWQFKNAYPGMTATVRLVLSALVLVHLLMLFGDGKALEQKLGDMKLNLNIAQDETKTISHQQPAGAVAAAEEVPLPSSADKEQDYSMLLQRYQHWVRASVAFFAYNFEADSKSRCEKPETAHSVELNDYELLLLIPDKQQAFGYRFSVIPCKSAAFPLTASPPMSIK